MFYNFGGRNHTHNGKQVLYVVWFHGIRLSGSGISEGTFYFLFDLFGRICQVNGVSFRFSHLPASVQPGNFHQFLSKVVCDRLFKKFHTVEIVEPAGKFTGHLQMLFLIFSHGHLVGVVNKDIGSHQRGVGK
ncbi:hypothetical protein SDC9_102635 [bioreactor metagenome]|uniref:Uncharacterized protein n=1 Tax=bioreactor metagenome TaxID=1076179 RepID=A0A645ASV1_9ZZZZ